MWKSFTQSGEALQQFALRYCVCPILGGIWGWVWWGCGQSDPVGGNPAYGRVVGIRWSLRLFPTQTILWFCKTSILMFPVHRCLKFFQDLFIYLFIYLLLKRKPYVAFNIGGFHHYAACHIILSKVSWNSLFRPFSNIIGSKTMMP